MSTIVQTDSSSKAYLIGGILVGLIVLGLIVGLVIYFTVFKKSAAIVSPTPYVPPTPTPYVPPTATPMPVDSGTTTTTVPAPTVSTSTTPSAPVPQSNLRNQTYEFAKSNIQPYTAPTSSYGYAVQAIKRNNPDYTLYAFNNTSFDNLATSNDDNVGTKFAGFKPGMYLIGGAINSNGISVSGEYMYCRVVGSGSTGDPRRIACGTPDEPLKFDTKGLDLGYDGTSFIGTMYGATTGPDTMRNKTTLCRSVGNSRTLACFGLDSNNRTTSSNQYDSVGQIRPKTDGLP